MHRYVWFGLGILARVIGLTADLYSAWIWNKLAEGAEATLDFLEDLWEFGKWALDELANRWNGGYPPSLYYNS
jgi:hypothetical protein